MPAQFQFPSKKQKYVAFYDEKLYKYNPVTNKAEPSTVDDEYYCFSNFYDKGNPIIEETNGTKISYPTSENYFQAQKIPLSHPDCVKLRKEIAAMPASQALLQTKTNTKYKMSPEQLKYWDEEGGAEYAMYMALTKKMAANPAIKAKLFNTGDAYIIEDTWHNPHDPKNPDEKWGMGKDGVKGQNKLGILLMRVRDDVVVERAPYKDERKPFTLTAAETTGLTTAKEEYKTFIDKCAAIKAEIVKAKILTADEILPPTELPMHLRLSTSYPLNQPPMDARLSIQQMMEITRAYYLHESPELMAKTTFYEVDETARNKPELDKEFFDKACKEFKAAAKDSKNPRIGMPITLADGLVGFAVVDLQTFEISMGEPSNDAKYKAELEAFKKDVIQPALTTHFKDQTFTTCDLTEKIQTNPHDNRRIVAGMLYHLTSSKKPLKEAVLKKNIPDHLDQTVYGSTPQNLYNKQCALVAKLRTGKYSAKKLSSTSDIHKKLATKTATKVIAPKLLSEPVLKNIKSELDKNYTFSAKKTDRLGEHIVAANKTNDKNTFRVYDNQIVTESTDVELFKDILKGLIKAGDHLPKIETDERDVASWIVAVKAVYKEPKIDFIKINNKTIKDHTPKAETEKLDDGEEEVKTEEEKKKEEKKPKTKKMRIV